MCTSTEELWRQKMLSRSPFWPRDPEALVPPPVASRLLGVGLPSLKVYRSTGRLPAATPKGKPVQYKAATLAEYIDKRWRP